MPVIEIDGVGRVEVGDDFLKMDRASQDALVGQITQHAQNGHKSSDTAPALTAAAPAPAQPQQAQQAPQGAPKGVEFPNLPTMYDLPTPQGGIMDRLKTRLGPLATDDQTTRANIIKNNPQAYPGATITQDKMGNQIVNYQGKQYYTSKPGGVDAMDVARGVIGTAAAVPLAGAAAAVAPAGAALTAAALSQGVAAAGQSIGEDYLAHAAGGENTIDPAKAAISGGLGAVGTVAARPLAQLGGQIASVVQRYGNIGRLLDDTGALTTTGKAVFQKAGVDPAQFQPSELKALEGEALKNVTTGGKAQAVGQAAVEQRGAALGIPHTVGQITGDVAQINKEDALRQGARGAGPESTMAEFGDKQRGAFNNATDNIRQSMTGQPERMDPNTAGQAILDAFHSEKQAAYNAASGKQGAVAQQLKGADLAPASFMDLDSTLRRDMMSKFDLSDPELARTRHFVDTLYKDFGSVQKPDGSFQYQPIRLDKLQQFRQQLNSALSSEANSQGKNYAGLSDLKRNLDQWVTRTDQAGGVLGDQAAVGAWRDADKAWGQYHQTFTNKTNAVTSINSMLSGADKQGMTGGQFFNQVFGAAGSKQGTEAAVDHLLTIFKPGTDGYSALREAWINKMIPNLPARGSDLSASYTDIAKGLRDAMLGPNKTVTEKLFNTTERAKLMQLADESRLIGKTSAPQNGSRTSYLTARDNGGVSYGRRIGGALGGAAFGTLVAPAIGSATGAVMGDTIARIVSQVAAGNAAKSAVKGAASKPLSDLLPATNRYLAQPASRLASQYADERRR